MKNILEFLKDVFIGIFLDDRQMRPDDDTMEEVKAERPKMVISYGTKTAPMKHDVDIYIESPGLKPDNECQQ